MIEKGQTVQCFTHEIIEWHNHKIIIQKTSHLFYLYNEIWDSNRNGVIQQLIWNNLINDGLLFLDPCRMFFMEGT